MKYTQGNEMVLFGVDEEFNIPEVKLSFESNGKETKKIIDSLSASEFLRSIFPSGSIELQEQFLVLYMSKANMIKGYYRHAVGGISSVITDPRIILAGALKSLSTGIIICHNHPSGALKPSEADIAMTKKIKEACNLLDIELLDHLIITISSYYSFADQTTLLHGIHDTGLNNQEVRARIAFIEKMLANLKSEEKEKLIRQLRNGVITKATLAEEGYEKEWGAINEMLRERSFSHEPLSFDEITKYNSWFALHPEKVCGEEILTSSLSFPVSIKGDKETIVETIEASLRITISKKKDNKINMTEEIRKSLLALDGINNNEWYSSFQGLDGTAAIQELGELGEFLKIEIAASESTIKDILQKEKDRKKYSSTDILSFDEVIRLYNTGITEDEIKAWVWYKRTLGFTMAGWDRYYFPNSGEAVDQLFASFETMVKDNHFRDLNKVPAGTLLGKPTKFKNEYAGIVYMVFTGTDGNKYYVAEKDTEVNKAGFRTDPKFLDALVNKGVLLYHAGEFLPYAKYAFGNMYDRELALEKDKDFITRKYGEEVYNLHKEAIAKAKPGILSITNPDPKERPRILSISKFSKAFLVKELRIETGIELSSFTSEPHNLTDAFKIYLKNLDATEFKEVSAHDIIHYYLNGYNLRKSMSDEEKENIEQYTPIEGEELFSRFLYEALTFEDQQKIDFSWNREFNGQSSVQHHKIPVGFTCSAMFKSSVLEFTPAQREAIAFMEAVGSGVIAYDVGVGKTMSAIITLANAMYQKKCKTPLVVVPNPTYQKWVREIIGYTDEKSAKFIPGVLSNTGIKVNEWYNLGTEVLKKIDLRQSIAPNTITVITYEGFSKLGYSEKLMGQMFEQLAKILSQENDGTRSERDQEKKFQTYREIIGQGLKDTIVDIDTLGIDYLVIDEAHNFKNIFSDVKSEEDGVKRFHLHGAQSARGIKAFFLCNYIQRAFGQNVMLLTATPFTNSPLEIYSMLSLVAFEAMKEMGITNLVRFMETFVQQTLEYAPNYKDEIVTTPVVKSYNNRLVLQKLIYNHINYKTGEEAGVKRPCKINLPRINAADKDGNVKRLSPENQVLTYLAMNTMQRENQQEIVELAKSGTGRNKNIIVALGQSLDNALSPFLYKNNLPPEDYKEFVESSPKIRYALNCIRTVKQYHEAKGEPVSGQIIYANRGKDYFPMIKEYLEKEIGYKQKVKFGRSTLDEVEVISSGISQDKKEAIKEAFLEGVVKIIIGTATIREGIDLQKKCANIYNLYPEWNPTDIKQLEGRAWRQGNEFGYVRVTMPLVENSMDVFVFQKLDEKMNRINDIWYKGDRGNVLDVESLDPEEVKFALFTNIDALVKLQLDKETKDLNRRLFFINSQIDTLKRFDFKLRKFFEYQTKSKERVRDLVFKYKEFFLSEPKKYDESQWWKTKSAKEQETYIEKAERVFEEADVFLNNALQEDKELLRVGRQLEAILKDPGFIYSREDVFSEFKAYLSEVKKAEKTILEQKGFTINDNFEKIIAAFENDKAMLLLEVDRLNSQEYRNEVREKVIHKKEKLSIAGKTIEERVEDFAKLNYLLDFKSSDVGDGNCALPAQNQRPPLTRRAEAEDKQRRLRIAKAEAESIRLKLELLNLD